MTKDKNKIEIHLPESRDGVLVKTSHSIECSNPLDRMAVFHAINKWMLENDLSNIETIEVNREGEKITIERN